MLPFISDEIDKSSKEVSKLKVNISDVHTDIQQEVSDREEGDNILKGNNKKWNFEQCLL